MCVCVCRGVRGVGGGGRNAIPGVQENHKTLVLGGAVEIIMQLFLLFLLKEAA